MKDEFELKQEAREICKRLGIIGNNAILYTTLYSIPAAKFVSKYMVYCMSHIKSEVKFLRAWDNLVKKGLLLDEKNVFCLFDRLGAAFEVPMAKSSASSASATR